MKKSYFFAVILLALSSCSTSDVLSDDMQPDGTYRIVAGGNAFANQNDAKSVAYQRADGLCPNGYSKKSEMVSNLGIKPRYQLIVLCK
jgi:hypothetical protein